MTVNTIYDYYLSVPAETDMPDIPEGVSVDVIGEWAEVPGWYFNARSVEPIDWPANVTQSQPATPWRVWG